MGNERRRYPRVTADLPLRLLSAEGKEAPFDLVDLSETGARITCAQAISAMTRVQVTMVLPGRYIGRGDDVRLDTTGVVVWSHEVEGGRYDMGVFFSELGEEHRELLQSLVQSSE